MLCALKAVRDLGLVKVRGNLGGTGELTLIA